MGLKIEDLVKREKKMSSLRKVKINTFQQYSHPVIIALTKYLICVIRVIRGFRSGFKDDIGNLKLEI